jgi:L-lysine 6-transaminase
MPTFGKNVQPAAALSESAGPEFISARKTAAPGIGPRKVIAELEKHILVDGFKIVIDLKKSHGSWLVDAATQKRLVDLYSFYASTPVGYNHPYLNRPEIEADLLAAAKFKVANSDMYSLPYARFVDTFARVMPLRPLERFFFIEGGAAAVENALKAAMDWKVRKNIAAGRGERGTEILHFEHAFHGRSGYTMSLTNTDVKKVAYFARFAWPRSSAPFIDYSLPEPQRTADVVAKESLAEQQIREVIQQKGTDIAAIIIEPIQGEGGDNHFRKEWFQTLRRICDENEILLIFDEVQCGMGLTGKGWCCEHFDVRPDILCFGKKAQVCGIMGGPRLDEVENNVFRLPGRINSTWGGNFTDFVRSTHFMEIIEQENLIENARIQGAWFIRELEDIARRFPVISAVRGRGLMIGFDLPDNAQRDAFWRRAYELGLLVVRSGEHSIRLRPVLDIKPEVIELALKIIAGECQRLAT